MKKILLSIIMLSFISGCAAITNTKKPPLRTHEALKDALKHEVIEYKNRYLWGNACFVLIPVAGFFIFPFGTIIDYTNDYNYAVTNKEKYEIWKRKYLKKQEDYFHNDLVY